MYNVPFCRPRHDAALPHVSLARVSAENCFSPRKTCNVRITDHGQIFSPPVSFLDRIKLRQRYVELPQVSTEHQTFIDLSRQLCAVIRVPFAVNSNPPSNAFSTAISRVQRCRRRRSDWPCMHRITFPTLATETVPAAYLQSSKHTCLWFALATRSPMKMARRAKR